MIETLANLIAYVESNNNQFSMRFEEKYFQRKLDVAILHKIKMFNICSFSTAKMIASTSWGAYQIMGINLYSVCGFSDEIGKYLCDVSLQYESFVNFIRARVFKKDTISSCYSVLKELKQIKEFWNNVNGKYGYKLEKLKEYLSYNRENFHNLEKFILRYNGARFLSTSFLDYLLRLLYHLDKI